jgi:hypothetical protein
MTHRLRRVRVEVFGEDGVERLASVLRISAEHWRAIEGGADVPGRVFLRFLEATGASPLWLLTGEGKRYASPNSTRGPLASTPSPPASRPSRTAR